MARKNYLHQPTLPLSFLFGWSLTPPLPSQHGQKQQPAPAHTVTLLSLWLVVPFCTPPQPTCQKQLPAPNHTATLLSLWLVPFCTLPQPPWLETTTCTNPHCHSPFSLVHTFLHPSPANMPTTTACTNPHRHSPFSLVDTFLQPSPTNVARNNYLHQPSLWLVPFRTPPQPTWPETTTCTNPHCTPPQTIWPETTTCTSPHCHSSFSLVGIFLHPSPDNVARKNYLHQPTLTLSFLFGWYLSAPLPSQHGQKELPAPAHTDTLLSLWLVPFCTPSPANMARKNYLHQPTLTLSFLFGWYLSAPLPSQHGQRQLPTPTHTAALSFLFGNPFCPFSSQHDQKQPPVPTHTDTLLSL
jgi:hypothetical protein